MSGESGHLAAKLDELLAPWARSDAPGLAVGVMRSGTILYRRGFGLASIESGLAIRPTTRFRIGSITKHFTALLALLLEQEGRLSLDQPIRTYLPELEGWNGEPSLRLLLQNRGGVRCHLDLHAICRSTRVAPRGAAFAALVRSAGRNFPAGEAMIYSNGGYHLVSLAIERVGGASLADQMRGRFFQPLGMHQTELVPSDYLLTAGIATFHLAASEGNWRRGLFPSEEMLGEGGIVSTLDDMLLWMGRLFSSTADFQPEVRQSLTERPRFPDGSLSRYALGIRIEDYRGIAVLQHSGGVTGGSSHMLHVPAFDLNIAVLANGAVGARPSAIANQILDRLHEGELSPTVAATSSAGLEDLLGEWWSAETGLVYGLHDEGGKIQLSVCGQRGYVLEPFGPSSWVSRPSGLGDIELDLRQIRAGGHLNIRFGGRTARYQRLRPEEVDGRQATRLSGRYRCEEIDCEASIVALGDRMVAVFRDAIDKVETELAFLSPKVAIARSANRFDAHISALTFDSEHERPHSLRLSTARTRDLLFAHQGTAVACAEIGCAGSA